MRQIKIDPRFGKVCTTSIASLAGPVIFVLVAGILGSIQPSYNPYHQTVSALVLGSFGWVQIAAFFIFGFLLYIFAWRVYASVANKNMILKIATVLISSVGIGFFIIGIFPTDPQGVLSLNSIIHFDTVLIISVLFTIVYFLLAFSFKNDPFWRSIFMYTMATACIAALLIVNGIFWALESDWTGIYERIFLINGLIWVEVVSLRLLTTCRAHFQNCCKLNFGRKINSII
jgi:hypothetical protein